MTGFSSEYLQLFMSLFKGREDVFAIRWEKEGKSGYMPSYDMNWDEYSRHKARGGTFKDFPNKKYSKLTTTRILNHLTGKETIGLYPLLTDNSSCFIVADFDESLSTKRSWIDECGLFLKKCEEYNIPAYLERSRSGSGGHVWSFFDQKYPAVKSRKIILYLLEESGIISLFDKNTTYDRLFPNQDYHSGKGLGNLIALPLQKLPLENNNSCFIFPDNLQPYPNQLDFLRTIKRAATAALDGIYQKITRIYENVHDPPQHIVNKEIVIKLSRLISIERIQLTKKLIVFLRDNLNFINSEYIIKKKLGKSAFGIEPYFKILVEKEGNVLLPRGFIGKLMRFCKEENITHKLIDERKKLSEVNFSFKASLYNYQEEALKAVSRKEMGVIVAPPGSGKTIIGLAIAASRKQPTLIIVHRKQLFEQWIERIQSFLGIAEAHIGKIVQGKQKLGTHITVAMIQSLTAIKSGDPIFSLFGTIIVDECHHVPARTFRQIINQLSSYYLYGLTATPIRKSNDERLIFIHLGDVIANIQNPDVAHNAKLSVIVRDTALMIPFDYKTDDTEILSNVLIHDVNRNRLITEDIQAEINTGKKVLVLTERKVHIDILAQYIKNRCEVITISGDDSVNSRKLKFRQISDGHFQVLLTTGQFLGEGADIDNIECLMLAYPFSFEGKLIQYIGRVQRSEATPVIYDYRDVNIGFYENQFRQRNKHYKKLLNTGSLEKSDYLFLIFSGEKIIINNTDYVLPISCLDIETPIERFKEDVVWLTRVLNYNEDTGELTTEILNYGASFEPKINVQKELQFLIIEKIKFRTINTDHLLRSVDLKQIPLAITNQAVEPQIEYVEFSPPPKAEYQPAEQVLVKDMKVPFNKIQFKNAHVSFPVFIEELKQEVEFQIENPDIRVEFEAIKEYFVKVLKRKIIGAKLEIRFTQESILSTSASSEDIDKINSSIIDSVRFEFVKRRILSGHGRAVNTNINTLDNLLGDDNESGKVLFKSDQGLIDEILAVKNSKHYQQLKYLSGQHLSSILKLRFILNPFSFVFLLAGDSKYHLVWETLNSEEATYIWHCDRTMEALRNSLNEVNIILNEIQKTGKQDYLKKEHDNFSRVMHDYSDANSGFVSWKAMLKEKIM